MNKPQTDGTLVFAVRDVLVRWFQEMQSPALKFHDVVGEDFGKMLRTRLASYLLGDHRKNWPRGIEEACAAVELIHTASLFHDDVVDGASIRRGKPALWKLFSPNGAILFGDILFCEALSRLAGSSGARYVKDLLEKGREVCLAEARQELNLRGTACDIPTCLSIARGKTGPLFAYVARACGDDSPALSAALEEAGYRVGTAYQLADDFADEEGSEAGTGKTLGTDRLRRKFTLAQSGPASGDLIRGQIRGLCESALQHLKAWPARHAGLDRFLDEILYPAFEQALGSGFPGPAFREAAVRFENCIR